MTHNTKECRKYDKDGKAVAATAGKPYEKKPYKKNGGGSDKQMAYLTATTESLVKKGIKKAGKKKRKKRSSNLPVAIPTVNRNLGIVTRDYA